MCYSTPTLFMSTSIKKWMTVHLFMCFLCVSSWALSRVCPAELRGWRVLSAVSPQQGGLTLVLYHQEEPTKGLLCGRGSSFISLSCKGREEIPEHWNHGLGWYKEGWKCHFTFYTSLHPFNYVNVLLITAMKSQDANGSFEMVDCFPFICLTMYLLLWGPNRIIWFKKKVIHKIGSSVEAESTAFFLVCYLLSLGPDTELSTLWA